MDPTERFQGCFSSMVQDSEVQGLDIVAGSAPTTACVIHDIALCAIATCSRGADDAGLWSCALQAMQQRAQSRTARSAYPNVLAVRWLAGLVVLNDRRACTSTTRT
jgi:hypothetical protein